MLGTDDIYLDAVSALECYGFQNDSHIHPSNNDCTMNTTTTFCCNFKQFQDEVSQESKNLDNLLRNLWRYYKEVKTKLQLCLDALPRLPQLSEAQK